MDEVWRGEMLRLFVAPFKPVNRGACAREVLFGGGKSSPFRSVGGVAFSWWLIVEREAHLT